MIHCSPRVPVLTENAVTQFYQRIISNDSYAHDEQGVNPGQVRGLDGVLYKL